MSWKNRATSKSWRAPPKNVELMPQHQDLGFQLLSRVSRAGRAASPQRRSSNANSLYGQNSAGFPQICATFQRDNLRRHF
jgi:hypothetical protein